MRHTGGPAKLSSHRRQRGRQVLEQLGDGQLRMCLAGHECTIDRRERETREVVRGTALWIERENDLHLLPQALECELPHSGHDAVDLALAGAHRLGGHHDEDPQEVRMAVEQ